MGWVNKGDKTIFFSTESNQSLKTTRVAHRFQFLRIDSSASVRPHYLFPPKLNDFLHSIFFLLRLDNTVGRVDKLYSVLGPDWQANGLIDPPENLCDAYRWYQTWRIAPL